MRLLQRVVHSPRCRLPRRPSEPTQGRLNGKTGPWRTQAPRRITGASMRILWRDRKEATEGVERESRISGASPNGRRSGHKEDERSRGDPRPGNPNCPQAALKYTMADAPTTTKTNASTKIAGSKTTSSALPVVVPCISRMPTVAR